jgi:hypothetical protein
MSVQVTYSIICDQCGARLSGVRKSPNIMPHLAYNIASKKTRDAGWVKRGLGSKGDRHYCFGCISREPELATWHMQKLLTKP